jgi:hypothetical protein
MELRERRLRYQAIEDYRKRPLIVYATSTRPGLQVWMAGDAVRGLITQVDAIPTAIKEVDVLIHSTGGDGLAAWKLMSLLRERFSKVGVLVPFMAFSAATLFALGADEIVMHPHASLGPIDPQIGIKQPDGTVRQFAYEDVGAFLRFLTTEVKITEQAHTTAAIERLFSVVDPVHVGAAKRASELSSAIGERLLLTHMEGEHKIQARQIAENLNKSFFAHGDAVSRTRAGELKLKVADANPELEKLMWASYLAIESYLELQKSFAHLQIYLSDAAAAASLAPAPAINFPPNMPPQFAQQAWQAAANQALQNQTRPVEVPYTTKNALIESTRVASEHKTEGKISGFVTQTGEIKLSVVVSSATWSDVPESPAPNSSPGASDTSI